MVYQAFFSPPPAGDAGQPYREAPLAMLVPLCLTAVLSVVIGIYPDFFMHLAQAVLP